MPMSADNATRLVPPLIALQFAVFGWRINREIAVGDAGRKTWFPLPDILNIISMAFVVLFLVIIPLVTDVFEVLSRAILGAGYVLLAFHPITMTAHYRLLTREGRALYTRRGEDFPYATPAEILAFILSLVTAGALIWYTMAVAVH